MAVGAARPRWLATLATIIDRGLTLDVLADARATVQARTQRMKPRESQVAHESLLPVLGHPVKKQKTMCCMGSKKPFGQITTLISPPT